MNQINEKIVDMSLDAIVSSDEKDRIILWNPAAERMFGYTKKEALEMCVKDLIPEKYRDKHLQGVRRFIATEKPVLIGSIVEVEGLRKDGSIFPKEVSLSAEKVDGLWLFTAIMRDITERKELENRLREQKKFLSDVIEFLPHPFYVLDANEYTIKMANSAAYQSPLKENFPACYSLTHNRTSPCDGIEHACPLETVKRTKKQVSFEHVHYDKKGNQRIFQIYGYPIFDDSNNVIQMAEYAMEITEQKQAEKDLIEAATTERLTKLLNRSSFENNEKKIKEPVLLLVNIDRFKHVNDFYGIQMGDFVLKELSVRLKNIIPEYLGAMLYKLGGDDFGVLFEGASGNDPVNLAQDIVNKIEKSEFNYEGNKISISISIGISRERPLLEKADMVLKYIKRYSRLKYLEYDEKLSLQKNISENMRNLSVLKTAISRNKIISYFQPIISNTTDKISKYECLVRIMDEDGKVISPGSFLNVAKESKLYGEITRRMVENGFVAFRNNDHEFSINVSIEDIYDKVVEEFVVMTIEKHPEMAERCTFEILESEGIENYQSVYEFIQMIKGYGCKIAIDDFGAGYSNFSHIMNFNVDYIKIDSSLIKNIDKSKNSQILVETMVNYARRLGIKTIAEYVHSENVHKKVKELGVDYSQGYFIGEPRPTIDIIHSAGK